jgi:hypothetical protein
MGCSQIVVDEELRLRNEIEKAGLVKFGDSSASSGVILIACI